MLMKLLDPSFQPFLVLLLALTVDAVVGDPRLLYRLLPHPVVLIGKAIDWVERNFNSEGLTPAQGFSRGLALTLGLTLLAAWIGLVLHLAMAELPLGWLLEAILASSLFAARGLYDAVKGVALALREDLAAARQAVTQLVGRDPRSLDDAGIARATLESLAENFSDGVVAPAFWFALLGLPGLCAYKAVNTLDSMIGHREPRYEAFGKVAARLDDVVNLIPARLAGLLLVIGALLLPGASARQGLKVMWRDAGKHRSPNAGWPEAALAGALEFALAGPRRYGEEMIDDGWMGHGRSRLGPIDIMAALRLYCLAGVILFLGIAVVAQI